MSILVRFDKDYRAGGGGGDVNCMLRKVTVRDYQAIATISFWDLRYRAKTSLELRRSKINMRLSETNLH